MGFKDLFKREPLIELGLENGDKQEEKDLLPVQEFLVLNTFLGTRSCTLGDVRDFQFPEHKKTFWTTSNQGFQDILESLVSKGYLLKYDFQRDGMNLYGLTEKGVEYLKKSDKKKRLLADETVK